MRICSLHTGGRDARRARTESPGNRHTAPPKRSAKRDGNRSRRHGVAALEFIIAVPALVLVLFAAMQFSLTSAIGNTVNAAVHEAARCCQLTGRIDDAADIVNRMLGVHRFGLGGGARLVLQEDSGAIQSRGDASLSSTLLATAPPIGTCRAVLIVNVAATPAPNMLSAFCLDFSNRRFESSSVVTRDPDCL